MLRLHQQLEESRVDEEALPSGPDVHEDTLTDESI